MSFTSVQMDNYYQNSFKQLNLVQQRQVGLIVGIAVGDAAGRALDGYSSEEINAYEKQRKEKNHHLLSDEYLGSNPGIKKSIKDDEYLAFAPPIDSNGSGGISLGSEKAHSNDYDSVTHSLSSSSFLSCHSYSYSFFFSWLKALARSRGDFPVDFLKEDWITAARYQPENFTLDHASLLHTCCILLGVPAIYPWSSDEAMRQYIEPFIDFLIDASSFQSQDNELKEVWPFGDEETRLAAQLSVKNYTLSTLGVILRCLQKNPDPFRNGAFMAIKGTGELFPSDIRHFCPTQSDPNAMVAPGLSQARFDLIHRQWMESYYNPATKYKMSNFMMPRRPVLLDVMTISESFSIARAAKSFSVGIHNAIRLGGPSSRRAMLVGALLGSRFGIRSIPPEWISATIDSKPLSSMAIEVAQWSWNPPHH